MKEWKRFMLFILATSLISACGRDNLPTASSRETVSASTSAEAVESSAITSDVKREIDQAFVEGVVLNFGAEKTTTQDGGIIINPQVVSLFYLDTMTEHDLTPGDIFSWYFGYSFNEGLSDEQRKAKYKSPLGEDKGWFFPAEYYEPVCLTYFNVTTDFLRSDPTYYYADYHGYTIDGGGGIGLRAQIVIEDFTHRGDLVKINIAIPEENRTMILTVRLTDKAYQFISYLAQKPI